jgi:DNA polymerase-3 subunit alpha
MQKRLCFIYTETTGLHKTNSCVTKKELFKYARMVALNYEIGYFNSNNKDRQFIIENKVRTIVRPRCMIIPKETEQYHNISQEMAMKEGTDPEIVISKLKKDLEKVDIIVSHSVDFHLRTILAEAVRYNINLDLSKFMIIDTMNFNISGPYENYIKLKDLATMLKVDSLLPSIDLIKNVFIKLYRKFEKANKSD